MKKVIKNIVVKFLTLAAVFGPVHKVQAESHEGDRIEPKGQVTVVNNWEQDGRKPLFGEVFVIPKFSLEKEDRKIGYQGIFWRAGYTDGDVDGWCRTEQFLSLENEDLKLRIGRVLVREYAGYMYCPTTPRFDDLSAAKGTGVGFTGIHAMHKATGLGFGIASSNNQMNPNDWDTGYLTWHKELCDEFAVQAHIGAMRSELTRAGLTAKWKPNKNITLVAEGIYKNKEMSELLTVNYQITDNLKAFGGFELTHPERGKAEGLITGGLDYRIKQTGIHLFAGMHQEIGGERVTSAVAGIRLQGVLKAAREGVNYHGL